MSGTSLTCAIVAGLAVAYATEEGRRLRSGRLMQLVSRGQAKRRIVGSLIVGLLMLLVDLGLEVIDPFARPQLFITVWTVAGVLVLLLLALGLLDMRELRANQEIERARQLLRMGREVATEASERPDPDDSTPAAP